ncbi:class II aldolase/adducin family protein [Planococcus sp. X10-3]|uniref:class II aldolase/adducin family protein n=1 Tax=Planococcus sp. X10-3 TaxID=3061240 RepID=UPI003BAF4C75
MNKDSLRVELQNTGKYMMNYNLAWGNAGNISARTSKDQYIITASGTFLGELELEDLVECDISAKRKDEGLKKPSKETPMHRAIYETRPEIGAVLHSSPFYSTLVACSEIEIPSNIFVETMYYLEKTARVPYFHPGSNELGLAVREKAKDANILFLENHGVLVYDINIKEARMALQTLEMACKMLVLSKSSGIEIKSLSHEAEKSFIEEAGYKPRRQWAIN